MKSIINKIAPASIAALTILGLTAPRASAQVTQADDSSETYSPYEITPAADRPGFALEVSGDAQVEIDQNHAARIADSNGNTREELPTSTETPDGQPIEIEYTELSDNELLIQYQAISH